MSRVTCPSCQGPLSAHLTPRDQVCPHCHNPLRAADLGGVPRPDVNLDVRRRSSVFWWVLGPIALVFVVAITLLTFAPMTQPDAAIDFVLLFSCLDVVAIIAVVAALRRYYSRATGTWSALLLAVLTLATIAGIVIVLFTTCQGLILLK
jgi:hypothetical protein